MKINVYSGLLVDPLKPKIDEITIKDIAHALSLMCRGNGHVKHFFSVAQHSINCALEAKARNYSKRIQLACLLHDGSEAYLSDIIRPVKQHLNEYYYFENNFQNLIYKKYLNGLTKEEELKVKEVDDALLLFELKSLMINNEHLIPDIKANLIIEEENFTLIEKKFIDLFNTLLD